ncbi:hypothetical protein GUITHDRAFT_163566 [Guillardia theta CCMP2712]|uniref:THIF-type NAD/FAD binding fold domain-containing protein n=1 Tax=Guillardia theta (strain CCMP2712) TaxID=905079 RepID=L1J7I3_GUITC|nr:hypothetical protein GUITHDRAFT_163566 [Guillardia theta CCMP2712]EKX44486.1 hypothetical protein GUITHDRAFT_163566 [Guillardia theta CCMP2712]|eukprot:XP_005831466.1 hypothetical protein GUITHDRAFT_163566 [Guillardia theta CCMP2712]
MSTVLQHQLQVGASLTLGAISLYYIYKRLASHVADDRVHHLNKTVKSDIGSTDTSDAWLERAKLLIGDSGIQNLKDAHVLVVGMGGVGSFAAEFLVRAGVGKLTIIDGDDVDPTNRNRQLCALVSTHHKYKAPALISHVDVMKERLLDVNPAVKIEGTILTARKGSRSDLQAALAKFLECEECLTLIESGGFDYVVDCIDSLQPKLHLMHAALKSCVPIVSSMGAGGKVDPSKVDLADISKTDMDPFAKFIRKRLRRQFGILSGVACVFSTEKPDPNSIKVTDGSRYKKSYYGTISYLPAVFGIHAASLVIRELGYKKKIVYTKTKRHLLKQGRSAAYNSDFLTRQRGEQEGEQDDDEDEP